MERFIFDLDGTLLFGNFEKERQYFKEQLGEKADSFLEKLIPSLMEYEELFQKYDQELLARFLTTKSGVLITKDNIDDWIDINSNMDDEVEESAIEVLEYLKSKNKSIVVLTNWFAKTQIKRLENSNLLSYIDEVYAGDVYLKPNPASYLNAKGSFNVEDCIMIGDTKEKDYCGPRKIGMHSILYNQKSVISESTDVIKSLKKIKEMY